jgi:hypothetical protein
MEFLMMGEKGEGLIQSFTWKLSRYVVSRMGCLRKFNVAV